MPCLIEEDVSATKTKIPLADAEAHAKRLRDLFDGCYERWGFAGSIRRRRPEVGDIDHVVIPKFGTFGLFADSKTAESLMARRVHDLHLRGRGAKPPDPRRIFITKSCGDRRISVQFKGCAHEIYLCSAGNWGPILAIRTGSAEVSRTLVTRLRRYGYRQHDGRLWRISRDARVLSSEPGAIQFEDDTIGVPMDCPDEESYFSAAGLNIQNFPPERREFVPI